MLVSFDNVSFSYGDNLIFSSASFSINEGEKVALVGANGEGKTTLIKLITGGLTPDSGSVILKNGITIGYLEQNGGLQSEGTVYAEMQKVFAEDMRMVERLSRLSGELADCPPSSREYAVLSAKLDAAQKYVAAHDAYNTDDNIPNIIVGTEYVFKNDDWDIRAGVSGIYGDKANKKMGAGTAKSMYGVNPYIQGRYGNFYFWGDFLGAVVADGKNVGGEWRQASPYGLNASGEYRFDIGTFGKLGVTARYTWLDTGGRGISTKDAMRHYPSLSGDPAYNNVQAVYGGLNWYIRGDNLKLMLGYEWAQYSGTADDRHAAHRCDAQAFRTQLQIVF